MPAKRKDLGNYKLKIKKYLNKENQPWTKQGLNLSLGIDRKYIHDCRRRSQKWQKEFLKEYDKAINRIEVELLRGALVLPQYKWEYWKIAYPQEQQETNSINIEVNLQQPRVINNE